MVALFVLLGTTATFSYGLSLEDQVLKRSGQPVYLKDGTTCECERFWWLVLAVRQDTDRKVRMNAMSSILHMGELGKRGMGALEYAAENDAAPYNRERAAHFLEFLQAY